jgi:CRISPR-associated protein Cmr2
MREYYGFRQMQLNDILRELVGAEERQKQANWQLSHAKKIHDQQKRKDAVKEAKDAISKAREEMEQAADKAVMIEPHLAYLWFKACNSKLDEVIRDAWLEKLTISSIPPEFHFLPETSVVDYMPPLSFMLSIPFSLRKSYLSKDERDFYLLDNPLRKEKVFQTPMVAATSWKGSLRAALWQLGYKQDDKVTIRLLGNKRESEEQQAGRLHFFPTFLDDISLEVIKPHDRKTGIGARGPILLECVPEGTWGNLILIYVPFGPIGQTDEAIRAEIAEDLQVLAKGIREMLTINGFGAKTSSGFGTAEDQLVGLGILAIRAKLDSEAAPVAVAVEHRLEHSFNSLSEFCEELAPRVAHQLRIGGEA